MARRHIAPKTNLSPHGKALEKQDTQLVLHLARLSKTGWEILLPQLLQIITSLIHPRTDCAVSIWHWHGKSTTTSKDVQCIDKIARQFAFGVFKPHPLVFFKHDTGSRSSLTCLNAKAQKATVLLLSIPDSNLAAVLARLAVNEPWKNHCSNLHHSLHTQHATLAILPGPINIISQRNSLNTASHPKIRALIASKKEAAALFVRSHLGKLTKHNPTRDMYFSDRFLIPNEGTGAAALQCPSCTISPANLGDPTYQTVYKAELVGIQMAADLASYHRTRLQTSFWFFINNQTLI